MTSSCDYVRTQQKGRRRRRRVLAENELDQAEGFYGNEPIQEDSEGRIS